MFALTEQERLLQLPEASVAVLADAVDVIFIASAWLRHPARCLPRCMLKVGPAATQTVALCDNGPVPHGRLTCHRTSLLALFVVCPSAGPLLRSLA